MIRKIALFGVCLAAACMGAETFGAENGYKNLSIAVYFRYQETQSNGNDTTQLATQWANIEKQVHVDKVYLETTRNRELVTEDAVTNLKKFFADRGIKTSGALGLTVNEMNGFQTFCYTDTADREKVKSMVQFTARHFDEIILDDFFFNNSKTDSDIAAKGERSWTQFRTELMDEVSRDLILEPAKEVNPKVRIIIKYPNWYESFQALGYDLAVQPKIFDAIYTGTETRNADFGQRLQSYQSYLQTQYLNNIKPGGNQGGWIDGGTDVERYAEQFWDTLFAKVPEITLFNSQQITADISGRRGRIEAEAEANGSLANLFAPVILPDGSTYQPGNVARIAGYSAEMLDRFLGELGKPVGVATYKPCNSVGEEYLPTFFGTIGIPIDLVPEFPEKAGTVFLTRASAADKDLVEKTKKFVQAGGQAIVTSGLVEALGENGFQDIAEIAVTGRVTAKNFSSGFGFFGGFGGSEGAASKAQAEESDLNIVLPKLRHFENDTWNSILFNTANFGYPMVVGAERSTNYGKGTFYVIAIPDDFADLYRLPEAALNQIRSLFNRNMWVSLEAPDHVSLFAYDNRTFIVQNFQGQPVDTRVILTEAVRIRDLLTDQLISGQTGGGGRGRGFGGPMMGGMAGRGASGRGGSQASFDVTVPGHSFRVFSAE
ncbi:MAG: hypothetical protein JXR49_22995 [Acidobacteria bacterium]|nr:hypothetical protein [Acidobacteriota bacterium]